MEIKDIFPIRNPFHFAWHSRRHAPLTLPLCLIAAALIHGLALLLLDVVPGHKSRTRPHFAEMSVLFPGSPEYKKIAGWLEANDPALLSTQFEADPTQRTALVTSYRPTFDSATIHLLPPPAAPAIRPSTEIILPQDIISNLASEESAAPGVRPILPTTVEFQGELLHQNRPNGPASPPNAGKSAETSIFLVGVLANGKIGFIFPQKGSGSVELDQKAVRYLETLEMKETESKKIRWGRIVFHWGGSGDTGQKQ